jgi:hypothetical protein
MTTAASQRHAGPPSTTTILWYVKDPENYVFNYDAIDRIPYMAPELVGAEKAARGKIPTEVWWMTIVPTNSHEKTGYPTQKPIKLLNRIVQVHSAPGDTVLDFFGGSGTAGVAAAKAQRKYAERLQPWVESPVYSDDPTSRTRGAVGEKIVDQWLTMNGCTVCKAPHSGCDRVVNGVNMEVKFSTLWADGTYVFQQLRDQDYSIIPMCCVSEYLLERVSASDSISASQLASGRQRFKHRQDRNGPSRQGPLTLARWAYRA